MLLIILITILIFMPIFFLVNFNLSFISSLMLSTIFVNIFMIFSTFQNSILFILIYESWMILLFSILIMKEIGITVNLIFFWMLISSLWFSVNLLSEISQMMFMFSLFFLFKSLLISIYPIIYFNNSNSLGVMFYIMNSKILNIFYSFMLQNIFDKEIFHNMINSSFLFLIFLMFWGVTMLSSLFLLISNDLGGYLMSSLGTSQLLILVTSLMKMKVFFLGVFLDLLFGVLVSYLIFMSVNFFSNSLFGCGSLILLIFSWNSLGVPPFPSFFLELNFIMVMMLNFNWWLKLMFFFIFYLMLSLHFFIFFKFLGSAVMNPIPVSDLSEQPNMVFILMLGGLLSLFFQFFMFYGGF